ncbi:hypothetical protein C8A01DRAFT_21477 [Parachaetomium inaequale]|uniref:Uncharacterized protein n=1 Tax=Parachaetomium inaequale TaxID=2588326 RepID=A0AAN6P6E4_9PEZI|nr:hypothetical protein C8A01DRAFT_21477 [Parachaetomium inaequale]
MAPQQAIIISAFACSGKSWLSQHAKQLGYTVVDLDSSAFSFRNGTRNPNFLQDYIAEIRSKAQQKIILLVSTHDEVRKALVDSRLWYALVYPKKTLKKEWLQRMVARGSPPQLVAIFDKNWDLFIAQCMNQQGCVHFPLGPQKYLADISRAIVQGFQSRPKSTKS